MNLRSLLQRMLDPHGKQGQDYRLWSMLGLTVRAVQCSLQAAV
jgi:hypothetical protein